MFMWQYICMDSVTVALACALIVIYLDRRN